MRLVIIGAGFAGMYAALSAARLRDIQGVSPEELEIALVAPEPTLVIRPRLYDYLGGLVRAEGGVLLAAGGMPDHVRLLARLTQTRPVADVLRTGRSP